MSNDSPDRETGLLKTVLTDVQFWVPAIVLLVGVGLLILLHN